MSGGDGAGRLSSQARVALLHLKAAQERNPRLCLGVDLVAVEGDGVLWLDQPCLKARIGEQRLGQVI